MFNKNCERCSVLLTDKITVDKIKDEKLWCKTCSDIIKTELQILQNDHLQFEKVLREASNLRKNKLQLYGQSYNSYGLIGIGSKLTDKSERIRNILLGKKIKFESLRDSAIDLLNYAAMFIMVLDNDKRK